MSVYSSLTSIPAASSVPDTGNTQPGRPPTVQESNIVTLSGNQIQIGDLDFSDIKQSIIQYLKRQESPL